jgi:hypothetical protein
VAVFFKKPRDFFRKLWERTAATRVRIQKDPRPRVIALTYLALVLVGAIAIGIRGALTEDEAMTWTVVVDRAKVPGKPAGLWTWMLDDVIGPALIKIEAKPGGKWVYAPGKECGPDGDLGAVLGTANVPVKEAPVGALIAKIGGSTAGMKDGKIYVIGGKAIIPIGEKARGPVLLTINDERTGLADNSGELEVTISISPTSIAPADAAEDATDDDAGDATAGDAGDTAADGTE